MRNETTANKGMPKFPLGRLVATPSAIRMLPPEEIRNALYRHITGDWGILDESDREQNETALEKGYRLFSVYYSDEGVKFYIVTEHDRSVTTVLLPEDY